MEIRVLRYFLAIAEAESVTAAARRVHVAQPSLSRQLAGLEQELGVRLFTRRPGSLTLNAAGRRFRPVARDLVRRAEQATEVMAALGDGEQGPEFTVVASPSTVVSFLAPYMARSTAGPVFRDALQTDPNDVFDVLANSDADIGISTYPAPATLESAVLGRTPVMAQLPAGHRYADRDVLDLADLVAEPLILMSRSNVARLVLDEAVSRAGLAPDIVTETSSAALAQSLAARGSGVCLVTDGARFGLKELVVRGPEGPLTVPLYAGWDRDHYAGTALRELVARLQDFAATGLRHFTDL
ncbi:LysR substrate-binding domain-containing protein [Streptomyces sp. NPDC053750]|uniref:LysR family transcriptional regulator n=1 Tax=Streptomyces sp. NPDC053750 TaxID=3365714 RepID=UPI0037D72613